jgi:integrase
MSCARTLTWKGCGTSRALRVRACSTSHSKNETSKRKMPLNGAARGAITRMFKRADELGHNDPEHYLWCASQHYDYEPTKPAKKWDGAWRSLRDAAGLPGFRFHDLRHTVVTDLLEAGELEHVIQAVIDSSPRECWSTT